MRGWLWLVVSLAAAAFVALMGMRIAGAPPYTPVVQGLTAAAAARDTALLDRYGIPWQLEAGGQTLAVDSARSAEALRLLTGARAGTAVAPVALDPVSAGLERSIDSLLARTLGPGRAYVAVSAMVDRNRSSATALAYSRRGTPLSAQRSSAAGGGYSARSASVTWGRDTTVSSTNFAPGGVKRLQVALLLDASVPKRTAASLRSAVAAAAGLVRARGDRLTIARVRFPARSVPAKPASPLAQLVNPALAYAPLALAALGLCGFAAAALRRREAVELPLT